MQAVDQKLRRARGFTMIELLFVLFAMAAIAGIGLPRYANAVAHYQCDTVAQQVAAEMEYARSRARATSTTVKVQFDKTNRVFRIVGILLDASGKPADYVVRLGPGGYNAQIISAPTEIAFDRFGQANLSTTIILQVGSNWQRSLVLDSASGKVVVQ